LKDTRAKKKKKKNSGGILRSTISTSEKIKKVSGTTILVKMHFIFKKETNEVYNISTLNWNLFK
jgi:hypothetical protein